MVARENMTDIKQLGSILGVWAHPDDEAYSMAGVMAAAAQNGQAVACVTATRGEASSIDEARFDKADLANIRTAEMAASLAVVGCKDHVWLDFPDGGCRESNEVEAVSKLVEIIKRVQPDSVFTFGSDWQLNRHPDHQTVSEWTTRAFRQAAKPGAKLYYTACDKNMAAIIQKDETKSRIFFDDGKIPATIDMELLEFQLSPGLAATKEQALTAHASQIDQIRANFGELYLLSQQYECFCLVKTT
jgi:LmbE family N-acetylglucosaminyl deacetylase